MTDKQTTKQLLSVHFGLNPQEYDIVDTDGDLAMMHYRVNRSFDPRLDRPSHPDVRGWVVDTKTMQLVAKSFPYTPGVTLDELEEREELTIIDDAGTRHLFRKPLIKEGFEGTTIRVFRHGGKTYYASHRRLDTSKSRWGSSIPFRQMYDDLGGRHDLFDETKLYSPYCYVFLVVHPDVAHVSQQDIGKGHIQFLHCVSCYDKDTCKYPTEQVDWQKRSLDSPPALSLEQANDVLSKGGFLIVSKEDGDAIKVLSNDYLFRSTIRNNDPNLLHRLNELVDEVDLLASVEPIKAAKIPQKRQQDILRAYTALRMAVSPHLKDTVDKVYLDYLNLRPSLHSWILELEESNLLEEDNVPPRVGSLVHKARRLAQQLQYNRELKRRNTSEEQYKINLLNLLWKETAASLYSLYKGKKLYDFARAEQENV